MPTRAAGLKIWVCYTIPLNILFPRFLKSRSRKLLNPAVINTALESRFPNPLAPHSHVFSLCLFPPFLSKFMIVYTDRQTIRQTDKQTERERERERAKKGIERNKERLCLETSFIYEKTSPSLSLSLSS